MKIIEELEETKEDYTVEQWVILLLMAILTLMWSFEVYCTIKKINTFPFGGSAITSLSVLKRNMKNAS
jgi:hypothetical protein